MSRRAVGGILYLLGLLTGLGGLSFGPALLLVLPLVSLGFFLSIAG